MLKINIELKKQQINLKKIKIKSATGKNWEIQSKLFNGNSY